MTRTGDTDKHGQTEWGASNAGRWGEPDPRAQARNVRTNPTGREPEDASFQEDLRERAPDHGGSHEDESTSAADDRELRTTLDALDPDELARLSILRPGTILEQGAVYLDLNDRERGPFKALGGHEAGRNDRYVAKRDTDHELWNRLVGDDGGRETEPEIERPARAR